MTETFDQFRQRVSKLWTVQSDAVSHQLRESQKLVVQATVQVKSRLKKAHLNIMDEKPLGIQFESPTEGMFHTHDVIILRNVIGYKFSWKFPKSHFQLDQPDPTNERNYRISVKTTAHSEEAAALFWECNYEQTLQVWTAGGKTLLQIMDALGLTPSPATITENPLKPAQVYIWCTSSAAIVNVRDYFTEVVKAAPAPRVEEIKLCSILGLSYDDATLLCKRVYFHGHTSDGLCHKPENAWILVGFPTPMLPLIKENSLVLSHIIVDEGDYGGRKHVGAVRDSAKKRSTPKTDKKWADALAEHGKQCFVTYYSATLCDASGGALPAPYIHINYSQLLHAGDVKEVRRTTLKHPQNHSVKPFQKRFHDGTMKPADSQSVPIAKILQSPEILKVYLRAALKTWIHKRQSSGLPGQLLIMAPVGISAPNPKKHGHYVWFLVETVEEVIREDQLRCPLKLEREGKADGKLVVACAFEGRQTGHNPANSEEDSAEDSEEASEEDENEPATITHHHNVETVLKNLHQGCVDIVISMKVIGRSFDCPLVDTILFLRQSTNNTFEQNTYSDHFQAVGRAERIIKLKAVENSQIIPSWKDQVKQVLERHPHVRQVASVLEIDANRVEPLYEKFAKSENEGRRLEVEEIQTDELPTNVLEIPQTLPEIDAEASEHPRFPQFLQRLCEVFAWACPHNPSNESIKWFSDRKVAIQVHDEKNTWDMDLCKFQEICQLPKRAQIHNIEISADDSLPPQVKWFAAEVKKMDAFSLNEGYDGCFIRLVGYLAGAVDKALMELYHYDNPKPAPETLSNTVCPSATSVELCWDIESYPGQYFAQWKRAPEVAFSDPTPVGFPCTINKLERRTEYQMRLYCGQSYEFAWAHSEFTFMTLSETEEEKQERWRELVHSSELSYEFVTSDTVALRWKSSRQAIDLEQWAIFERDDVEPVQSVCASKSELQLSAATISIPYELKLLFPSAVNFQPRPNRVIRTDRILCATITVPAATEIVPESVQAPDSPLVGDTSDETLTRPQPPLSETATANIVGTPTFPSVTVTAPAISTPKVSAASAEIPYAEITSVLRTEVNCDQSSLLSTSASNLSASTPNIMHEHLSVPVPISVPMPVTVPAPVTSPSSSATVPLLPTTRFVPDSDFDAPLQTIVSVSVDAVSNTSVCSAVSPSPITTTMILRPQKGLPRYDADESHPTTPQKRPVPRDTPSTPTRRTDGSSQSALPPRKKQRTSAPTSDKDYESVEVEESDEGSDASDSDEDFQVGHEPPSDDEDEEEEEEEEEDDESVGGDKHRPAKRVKHTTKETTVRKSLRQKEDFELHPVHGETGAETIRYGGNGVIEKVAEESYAPAAVDPAMMTCTAYDMLPADQQERAAEDAFKKLVDDAIDKLQVANDSRLTLKNLRTAMENQQRMNVEQGGFAVDLGLHNLFNRLKELKQVGQEFTLKLPSFFDGADCMIEVGRAIPMPDYTLDDLAQANVSMQKDIRKYLRASALLACVGRSSVTAKIWRDTVLSFEAALQANGRLRYEDVYNKLLENSPDAAKRLDEVYNTFITDFFPREGSTRRLDLPAFPELYGLSFHIVAVLNRRLYEYTIALK